MRQPGERVRARPFCDLTLVTWLVGIVLNIGAERKQVISSRSLAEETYLPDMPDRQFVERHLYRDVSDKHRPL